MCNRSADGSGINNIGSRGRSLLYLDVKQSGDPVDSPERRAHNGKGFMFAITPQKLMWLSSAVMSLACYQCCLLARYE